MQIYFSPEMVNQNAQILNVVDQNNKAVGYMALIFTDKKIYVYGLLEEMGVKGDFIDLVKPYIAGIKNINSELEIYSYLSVGGTKLELEEGK